MGLKSTETPGVLNPDPKPPQVQLTGVCHQPKYILGNLLLLIKKPLSSDKTAAQLRKAPGFGNYKRIEVITHAGI
jgi:hypothetical protein